MTSGDQLKKWNTLDYVLLWVGVCFCVPTFMLVNSLWLSGFSFWSILGIIFAGSLLMGFVILFLSVIGYKYSLGFTEIIYQLFGARAARLITLMRGVVCAGWFGINVYLLSSASIDCFLLFFDIAEMFYLPLGIVFFIAISLLNIALAIKVNIIKRVERIASSVFIFLVLAAVVVFFSSETADYVLSGHNVGAVNIIAIFSSIALIFSYWSGLATNIPDFTRHAKDVKSAAYGNILGICIGMVSASIVSLLVGSSIIASTGAFVWNPLEALDHLFPNKYFSLISLFILAILMTTTNIAANCYPALICISATITVSHKKSSLILFFISAALCPWFIISSYSAYAYYWINIYSLFLMPLIGIMVTSFIPGPTCKIYLLRALRVILYFSICLLSVVIYALLDDGLSFISILCLILSSSINIILPYALPK